MGNDTIDPFDLCSHQIPVDDRDTIPAKFSVPNDQSLDALVDNLFKLECDIEAVEEKLQLVQDALDGVSASVTAITEMYGYNKKKV